MKKALHLAASFILVLLLSMSVSAATEGWKENAAGTQWRYYEDGVYVKDDWRTIDGNIYYFNSKGYRVKGFQEIDGNKYFFKKNTGVLLVNKHGYLIDDKYYCMGKTGICKQINKVRGMAGIQYDEVGATVWKAFEWSSKLKYVASVSAGHDDAWYAKYAFMTGKGDCRCMAASFYYMVKSAKVSMSNQVELVNAYRLNSAGDNLEHSWVERVVDGQRIFFDPNAYAEYQKDSSVTAAAAKKRSFSFTYGTSGTQHYVDDHGHVIGN